MERVAAMKRLYELINAGDIDGFGDQLADGFVEHEETAGLEPTKEGVKQLFHMFRASFPDLRIRRVEEVLPSAETRSSVASGRRARTPARTSWACPQAARASTCR